MTTATQEKQTARDFADELRNEIIGIRFHKSSFGMRKALSRRHSDEVADHLKTKRRKVSGSKKLYPDGQPQVRAILSRLNEAYQTWQRFTTYCPGEKGTRLLKKQLLERFEEEMATCREALVDACREADQVYEEILDQCREDLGDELFDRNDYPKSFTDSVAFTYTTRTFEPDEDLLRLAPATYQREQQRVAAMFESAAEAFESETREQLAELVDALLAKLKPEDGKKVKYTEAATTNLREFFERFNMLNIRCDADLTALVDQAESALGNATMGQYKRSTTKRREAAESFEGIKESLDALIIDAPARSIDFDALDDDE